MTFDLKNASATYQRVMNLIFHDILRVLTEVYIGDVVVKSVRFEVSLEMMKKYELRMNPLKCAFEVTSGRFLCEGPEKVTRGGEWESIKISRGNSAYITKST
jgi:hypothetical protein